MKTLLAMLLTMNVTLVVAQNAPAAANNQPTSKAHILSNAEFDTLLAKPEQLLLIDVRRPGEVSSIGGFPVYLSVQIGDLEKSTAWIPTGRRIVVVSNHAGRAGKGADILASKGFNVIGAIGAQTYEEAGGKLAKIVEPPPRAAAQAATAK